MNNSRANLREARLTDKSIDIRTYNGMVDFVSMRTQPGAIGEIVDQFGSANHEGIPFQRQLWWPCISDDDIVPFSIVEVYDSSPAGVDFYFKVRRVTAGAKLYAGNDQYVLTAGGDRTTADCWIKLVTPYEPVTCVTSDPSVGFMSSVEPDGSDGVSLVSDGSGPFICLTKPETDTNKIGIISVGTTTKSKGSVINLGISSCLDAGMGADISDWCLVCSCSANPWLLYFPSFICKDGTSGEIEFVSPIALFFDQETGYDDCVWQSFEFRNYGGEHIFQWKLTIQKADSTGHINSAVQLLRDGAVILTWNNSSFCCPCKNCFQIECNTNYPLPCLNWPDEVCIFPPAFGDGPMVDLAGTGLPCANFCYEIPKYLTIPGEEVGYSPSQIATLHNVGCGWIGGISMVGCSTGLILGFPDDEDGDVTLTVDTACDNVSNVMHCVYKIPLSQWDCNGPNTLNRDSCEGGMIGETITITPQEFVVDNEGNLVLDQDENPIPKPDNDTCTPGNPPCSCCFAILGTQGQPETYHWVCLHGGDGVLVGCEDSDCNSFIDTFPDPADEDFGTGLCGHVINGEFHQE